MRYLTRTAFGEDYVQFLKATFVSFLAYLQSRKLGGFSVTSVQ